MAPHNKPEINMISLNDFCNQNNLPENTHNKLKEILENEIQRAVNEKEKSLNERYKELKLIQDFAELVEKSKSNLNYIFNNTVKLIPNSWQYPEITEARINYNSYVFQTKYFFESQWKLTEPIYVHGNKCGSIDVIYTREKTPKYEGPFLKEERNLLYIIAERIGHIIERIQREQDYEDLFNTLNEAVIKADKNGIITAANRIAASLCGYFSPKELIGKHMEEIYANPEEREKFLEDLQKNNNKLDNYEFLLRKKDGTFVWTLANIRRLQDNEGNFSGTLGALHDMTDIKEAREKLYLQLKEKEILVRESHHRIKNNIATITNLLKIQMRQTTNEESKSILKDAVSRTESMGLLYEKLLLRDNFTNVALHSYIKDLISAIKNIFPNNPNISIINEMEKIDIDSKRAITIGIIINEFITNSMKYAFTEQGNGKINVKLSKDQDNIFLAINDNGPGLSKKLNTDKPTGLGLMLIKMMSEQLNADMELDNNNGMKISLRFKI